MEIKHHPDLAGFHRDLTDEEFAQLEENCLAAEKIIDPIKMWLGYVIDGKHRLIIAERHDLPYNTIEMEFQSFDEAKAYVIADQLGKRNLSSKELERLRVTLATLGEDTEAIAEATGVSRRTAQRDVEQSQIIQEMDEDIRSRYEQGTLVADRAALKRFADLTEEQQTAVQQELRDHPDRTMRQAVPKPNTGLTADDFSALDGIDAITPIVAERLSTGAIHADSASVAQFETLAPEQQEIIVAMLEDGVESLRKALGSMEQPKKESKESKEKRVKRRIDAVVDQLMELLDDLHAIKPNQKSKDLLRSKIETVKGAW